MKFNSILSKCVNYFRLLNKFRHLYYIKQSKKILSKIKIISKTEYGYGKSINYLKKINPYVFEELVLSAIENNNIHIKRNLSYSGDGGFDGEFMFKGYKILLQCKRYQNHISLEHVKTFARQINEENKKIRTIGIFFHTGKTGKGSKNEFMTNKMIVFVSGEKLIKFLTGEQSFIRTIV